MQADRPSNTVGDVDAHICCSLTANGFKEVLGRLFCVQAQLLVTTAYAGRGRMGDEERIEHECIINPY